MAIFNKSGKETVQGISNQGTTTIASGTKIQGDIVTECNLNIDGTLTGNIQSTCGIAVGKTGEVKGKILAERVIVSGLIDGDIECSTLEILSGGKVLGNVLSTKFIIEEDGVFEGVSKRKDSGVIGLKTDKKENKKNA